MSEKEKNEKFINLTDKIVNEFQKTLEMFGLGPMEARLFAYLYLSDETLTLDEMSEALGKSKTSMSTSIRSLAEFNLVKLVWKKGVRKDLYKANKPLFKTFMYSYINKWTTSLEHQETKLNELQYVMKVKKRNHTEEKELEILRYNLEDIIQFHAKVKDSMNKIKPK